MGIVIMFSCRVGLYGDSYFGLMARELGFRVRVRVRVRVDMGIVMG